MHFRRLTNMPNSNRWRVHRGLRFLLHAMAFALMTSLVAGCGIFSPDESGGGDGDGGGTQAYPIATSENQLIKNFEQAHLDRNFQEYDNLLDEDFQFWFSTEDLDLAPNGVFWDRAADVASTERMFNGKEGLKPDGEVQPAVQKIELTLEPTEPAWVLTDDEVVGGQTLTPPGTKKRRYTVNMTVNYTAGDITSSVNGEQLFYIVPTQRDLGDGTSITEWKLFIWRDFGKTL
jgi:hypothetical protein